MTTTTSYNVLCKDYAFKKRYPSIDPDLLRWEARQDVLLDKITAMEADLICLQEVSPAFFERLKTSLPHKGIYQPPLKGPQSLAIFYRKLRCVNIDKLYFEISGSDSGKWRPAQTVEFELERLGVINTHLAWDPDDAHAYAEIKQLLDEVISPSSITRWLICGDFNVTPDSETIALLRENGIHYAAEGCEQNTVSIKGFLEKVDYICYTNKTLKAEAQRIYNITEMASLPSPEEPSDHLAITLDIQLRP